MHWQRQPLIYCAFLVPYEIDWYALFCKLGLASTGDFNLHWVYLFVASLVTLRFRSAEFERTEEQSQSGYLGTDLDG